METRIDIILGRAQPPRQRTMPIAPQTTVRVMSEIRARGVKDGWYTIKAGPLVEMLAFVREFNERQRIEGADRNVNPPDPWRALAASSVWIDL